MLWNAAATCFFLHEVFVVVIVSVREGCASCVHFIYDDTRDRHLGSRRPLAARGSSSSAMGMNRCRRPAAGTAGRPFGGPRRARRARAATRCSSRPTTARCPSPTAAAPGAATRARARATRSRGSTATRASMTYARRAPSRRALCADEGMSLGGPGRALYHGCCCLPSRPALDAGVCCTNTVVVCEFDCRK